jgi:long-chain acyl-CoA synthetase
MWVKDWPAEGMDIEEATIGGVRMRINADRPRSLREVLRKVSALYPDKEAVIYEELRLTYKEIFSRINRISAALLKMGFEKGDRIGLLFSNTIEFVYSYFAICQMGAIAVPLNYRLSSEELEYQLSNTEAKGLILEEGYWTTFAPIRDKLRELDWVFLVGDVERKGVRSFSKLIQWGEETFPEPDINEEDIASIMFTSGTTGRPKGVMLSHRNLITNGMNASHAMLMNHDSKQLIITPFFHASALHAQLIPNVLLGSTAVILKRYSTKASLEIMANEKINFLVAVPTIYWFWVTYTELHKFDLSSMKVAITGGAPASTELITRFYREFPNTKFINAGGMTECTSGAWGVPAEFMFKKLGSVGFAFPCVDVRTVSEDGRDVGVNEPGDLWYRGPAVCMGYWNNEKAWAESFSDGWLHSGDIGKVDEDGFLWLLDRAKDMIIRAGENIYCIEVENALYQDPKIAEAAVVGVPDKIFGEKVKAFLVLHEGEKATAEEIREFCLTRLADYKVPEYIEFVSELPRNPSGKVEKQKLRDLG